MVARATEQRAADQTARKCGITHCQADIYRYRGGP